MACSAPLKRSCRRGRYSSAAHRLESRQASWLSYAGGYAISWLAYWLSTGSLPLIVVDSVGLLCAGLTLAVALSLRGSTYPPSHLEQPQHEITTTKTRSPKTRSNGPRHSDPAGGARPLAGLAHHMARLISAFGRS
jgi:hypothetical protein